MDSAEGYPRMAAGTGAGRERLSCSGELLLLAQRRRRRASARMATMATVAFLLMRLREPTEPSETAFLLMRLREMGSPTRKMVLIQIFSSTSTKMTTNTMTTEERAVPLWSITTTRIRVTQRLASENYALSSPARAACRARLAIFASMEEFLRGSSSFFSSREMAPSTTPKVSMASTSTTSAAAESVVVTSGVKTNCVITRKQFTLELENGDTLRWEVVDVPPNPVKPELPMPTEADMAELFSSVGSSPPLQGEILYSSDGRRRRQHRRGKSLGFVSVQSVVGAAPEREDREARGLQRLHDVRPRRSPWAAHPSAHRPASQPGDPAHRPPQDQQRSVLSVDIPNVDGLLPEGPQEGEPRLISEALGFVSVQRVVREAPEREDHGACGLRRLHDVRQRRPPWAAQPSGHKHASQPGDPAHRRSQAQQRSGSSVDLPRSESIITSEI